MIWHGQVVYTTDHATHAKREAITFSLCFSLFQNLQHSWIIMKAEKYGKFASLPILLIASPHPCKKKLISRAIGRVVRAKKITPGPKECASTNSSLLHVFLLLAVVVVDLVSISIICFFRNKKSEHPRLCILAKQHWYASPLMFPINSKKIYVVMGFWKQPKAEIHTKKKIERKMDFSCTLRLL